ncbi:MAG: hypothetical protein WCP55_16540 [Lentisphaerota bacterium]
MKIKLSTTNKEQLDGLFEQDITGGIREDLQYGPAYDDEDEARMESKGIDIDDVIEEQMRQGTVLAAKYLIKKLQGMIEEYQA